MSLTPEQRTLEHALARGYLDAATVDRARAECARSGQPVLHRLRELLEPEHLAELSAVYRQHATGSDLGLATGELEPTVVATPEPGPTVLSPSPGPSAPGGLPQAGARLGRYLLKQVLGQGGMGAVYLAWDPELERELALKVLLPQFASSVNQLERFRREAEALGALDHAGVVRVHDSGAAHRPGQPSLPYLALEFVRGESLQSLLRRDGALPLREAARLVTGIARAVHHAHQRGILHRDLKPDNVLVDEAGAPRVTDFGIARLTDREALTRTGEILGTPAYMAPEQAAGEVERIDARTDVYGVGAILYATLTGRPPFPKKPLMNMLAAVVMKDPEPPSASRADLPAELEQICRHAMRKEPADRYTSAAELADDLERWLAGKAIFAHAPSAGLRLRRWIRRNPVHAGAGLVVWLGVLALTGLAYRRLTLPPPVAEVPVIQQVSPLLEVRAALANGEVERAKVLLEAAQPLSEEGRELLAGIRDDEATGLNQAALAAPLYAPAGWDQVASAWTTALALQPSAKRLRGRARAWDQLTAERALGIAPGLPGESLEAAIADYRAAAELLAKVAGGHAEPWLLHLERAQLLELALERDAAIHAARQALEALPEPEEDPAAQRAAAGFRLEVRLLQARVETRLGSVSAAKDYLARAEATASSGDLYRVHLARAVLSRDRFNRIQRSEHAFDAALSTVPKGDVAERIVQLECALNYLTIPRGHEQGLELLAELEDDPTAQPLAVYWGARAAADLGKHGDLSMLQMLTYLGGEAAAAQQALVLGSLEAELKELRSWVAHALRLDPRLQVGWGATAYLLATQDDPAQALRTAETVTRVCPKAPALWNVHGWFAAREGDPETAERAFSNALGLEPQNFSAAWARAELRLERGDSPGAHQDLQTCLGVLRFLFGLALDMFRQEFAARAAERGNAQGQFVSSVLLQLADRFLQVDDPQAAEVSLSLLESTYAKLQLPLPPEVQAALGQIRVRLR